MNASARFLRIIFIMLLSVAMSGCNQNADVPVEEIEANAPARVVLTVHLARYEPEDGFMQASSGDRVVFYDPEPFITASDFSPDDISIGERPFVRIKLNDADADTMEAFTSQRIDKPIVIALDNVPISAPVVRSAVRGVAITVGSFEEAEAIAAQLRGK